MPQLGPLEIVLILAVVMIVFGVGKLPEVFGSMGKGVREFKKAINEDESAVTPSTVAKPAPESAPAAPASAPAGQEPKV